MNAQDRIALMIGRLIIQNETLADQVKQLQEQAPKPPEDSK